jgi:erythromycin esterase
MLRKILLLFIGLWLTGCTPDEGSTSQAVVWVQENAIPISTTQPGSSFADLQPLKAIIGEARLVSLGEATHGTHEFFQMKHRLVEFLVEEMGFTELAIEAYWPQADLINDYVHTGRGDIEELIAGLGYWPWRTEEMRNLIEWMRDYNARRGEAPPISFSGFDMQNVKLALNMVVAYFETVAPESADWAWGQYDCYRPYQDYTWQQVSYGQQPAETKAACRQNLQAVHDNLSDHRVAYEGRSSPEAFANALQGARLVLQNEAMAAVTEEGDFMTRERINRRDQAMAENVSWLLDQAGSSAKIILWAHNAHIQTTEWVFRGVSYTPMGVHLREVYAEEMLVFGFSFYTGSFNAYDYDMETGDYNGLKSHPADHPPSDSYEEAFHWAGVPRFFLDLGQITGGASGGNWLLIPHWLRLVGAEYDRDSQPEDNACLLSLPEAFGVLVYIDETTPSMLLP